MNVRLSLCWAGEWAGGPPDFSFVQLQYSAAYKSDQMRVTGHTVTPATVDLYDDVPEGWENQMQSALHS